MASAREAVCVFIPQTDGPRATGRGQIRVFSVGSNLRRIQSEYARATTAMAAQRPRGQVARGAARGAAAVGAVGAVITGEGND